MRQALDMMERTVILALGVALSAGAQAPPNKPAAQPQSPAKPAAAGTQAPAKPPAPAKPAPVTHAPVVKPAPAPQKPKPAPTPAAQKKPAPKPVEKAAAVPEKKEEAPTELNLSRRRDPFLALFSQASGTQTVVHLPRGPGGLQVSTLHVEGVVRSPNGMLAVISSPQGGTYFLHQGARLYDGRIEQISMDSVTFQESGKDPFGHSIDRTVVKRIYQSAGEQQ